MKTMAWSCCCCLESFISSEAKESTLPVVSYREVKESLIVYLISLLIIATYSLLRVFNGGSDLLELLAFAISDLEHKHISVSNVASSTAIVLLRYLLESHSPAEDSTETSSVL